MDSGGMSAYDAQRMDMKNAEDRGKHWQTLYEELRAAIDNGHESMTHADAVAWVREAHQRSYRLSKLEW